MFESLGNKVMSPQYLGFADALPLGLYTVIADAIP
jgi:hypothetical protein